MCRTHRLEDGPPHTKNWRPQILVLAKLDGTAKGGIAVAIRQELGIPVKYIGVGEQVDDLELFDPEGFVEALFSR